jgi:glycosyltransferase involved in cell wall biosynthesis
MTPTVSVVITNYNYERYIRECVASVLGQDFTDMEILIVDDGSTDGSRAVISSFEDSRVRAVYKENGGVISSVNLGFGVSRGRYIVFLDADDCLTDGAIAAHVTALCRPNVVRSQGYMAVVDSAGKPTGPKLPSRPAPDGDLRDLTLLRGPGSFVSAASSGNAWSRNYLERVLPLPEVSSMGADAFLMDASPLFGKTVTLDLVVANYRTHEAGLNYKKRNLTLGVMKAVIQGYETRARHLASVAQAVGYDVRAEQWLSRNWRVVTMKYLVTRLSNQGVRPRLYLHAKSVLATSGNVAKKAALLGFILALRVAPKNGALVLSRKLIEPRYM